MDLFTAIHTRRSVGKVKPDPVPRELIERMLEAAVWAPNHYRTEPWRFIVLTGDGRELLARAYTEIALGEAKPGEELRAEVYQKQLAKACRAPVVIVVAAVPSAEPKVRRGEELAATHAAVQNLLLAAHALGLGAIWRSGDPLYDPRMKAAFRLGPADELVGLIYVGYPDVADLKAARTPAAQQTEWIGS